MSDNYPEGYDRGHKPACGWSDCPGGIDCEGLRGPAGNPRITDEMGRRKHVVEILAMKMSLLRFDDEQSDRMIELTMREAGALAEHLYETVESLIDARMTVAQITSQPVLNRDQVAAVVRKHIFRNFGTFTGVADDCTDAVMALIPAPGDVLQALTEVYDSGAMGGEWPTLGTDAVMELLARETPQPVVDREALEKLQSYCGAQSVDSDATEAEQLAYDDVAMRLAALLGVAAPQPVVDL